MNVVSAQIAGSDTWCPRALAGAGLSKWALANLATAFLYCGLGWAVSQFFARYGLFPSPIWLPASIAIVAAMIGGARMLPGIFLGSLVANYALFDPPFLEAVAISLGNAAGPVIAVVLIRRLRPTAGLFNRLSGVLTFVGFAVLLHPAITATVGTASLAVVEGLPGASLPGIWIKWWLSDSGGTLFFAPAILLWLNMERESIPRTGNLVWKDTVFWSALFLTAVMLLVPLPLEGAGRWGFPFLMVVPISWIALRISLRAAYTLISFVSLIASAGAVAGFGPFQDAVLGNPLQMVGILVVLLALNSLIIIALVVERREAEEASRFKSMFLASASHDLRTPLNAIIGFAEMMKHETMGPLGSSRYRDYAAHIHDSGEILLDIVNDLLDLSRIESGKHDLDPAFHAARDVAASCMELVQMRADQEGIVLKLEIDPDTQVWADLRSLRQILINLIANAVAFTDRGGVVAVRSDQTGSDGTVFEVSDTGIGMTAEQIEIALQPFGRIRQGEAKDRLGTGLGLPISVRLVKLHGGNLSISSNPGTGTTIRVNLPAADHGAPHQETAVTGH